MWQVLSKEVIVPDPQFTVIKEKVKTNDNQEIDWYRFDENHDAAGVIAINDEGKILLQREFTYPLQEWVYDFPGGGINPNEDIAEGANRELIEEAGYSANTLVKIGAYLSNRRRSNGMMHIFLATDLYPAQAEKDEGEEIESFWVTEQELEQMIATGQIVSPRVLSAWTYYTIARKNAEK